MAQHEAQRQEDMLALKEKEKRLVSYGFKVITPVICVHMYVHMYVCKCTCMYDVCTMVDGSVCNR